MSARLKSTLAVAGSLLLGGGLLWLALRGADLATVGDALAGADWWWLLAMIPLSVLSVVVRAWRWRLLLVALPDGDEAGAAAPARSRETATLGAVTGATFIGYLVNYAAPRLGEFARAATVAQRSRDDFPSVFGTVVAERVLDVAVLASAIGATALLYGSRLSSVWTAAGATLARLAERLSPGVVTAAVGALVLLAVGAVWGMRRGGIGARLGELAGSFQAGLVALVRTQRPVALLASTLALWFSYVLLADVPLRMLGLTEAYGLSVVDAFAVMTIGAIGVALPSPGGTGSYHYATVQALTVLFGVGASAAATYAVLAHAAQVVFYALGGFTSLLALGTTFRAVRADADAVS